MDESKHPEDANVEFVALPTEEVVVQLADEASGDGIVARHAVGGLRVEPLLPYEPGWVHGVGGAGMQIVGAVAVALGEDPASTPLRLWVTERAPDSRAQGLLGLRAIDRLGAHRQPPRGRSPAALVIRGRRVTTMFAQTVSRAAAAQEDAVVLHVCCLRRRGCSTSNLSTWSQVAWLLDQSLSRCPQVARLLTSNMLFTKLVGISLPRVGARQRVA